MDDLSKQNIAFILKGSADRKDLMDQLIVLKKRNIMLMDLLQSIMDNKFECIEDLQDYIRKGVYYEDK